MMLHRNLCRLLTSAYKEGLYYKPRIDKEILAELSEGLIVLSGCLSGEIARALKADRMDDNAPLLTAYELFLTTMARGDRRIRRRQVVFSGLRLSPRDGEGLGGCVVGRE